jgi:CubicO group peptidase (beta-lactamase class C family)
VRVPAIAAGTVERGGYAMSIGMRLLAARGVVCALIALLVLSVTALPGRAAPRATAPDFAAIDRYVEQEMRAMRLPGLALGIVRGDQIVHLKGFGAADGAGRAVTPQTPFKLASLGKSFTALAVMQLVEAGKLELDAPVQRYLPWFRVADEQASGRITLRHLLNQTSGISTAASNAISARQFGGADAIEQSVRALATVELVREVGAAFEYANINYGVLGLVVQTVSGQPYAEYIQQHIFAPLAMETAYLDRAQDDARGAATGHAYWFGFPRPTRLPAFPGDQPGGGDNYTASAEDVCRYLIAHLDGGRYQGRQILSAAGIDTLHRPAVPAGEPDASYAMGWERARANGIATVGHSGAVFSFNSWMLLAPAERWGVVVLTNGAPMLSLATGDGRIAALAPGIISLLHGEQPPQQSAGRGVWLVYAALLLVVGVQIGGMVRTIRALRQRHSRPGQRPTGRWADARQIGLPLAANLVWGLAILVGLPAVSGLSLRFLSYMFPDVIAILFASALVALAWGALRTALLLRARRARLVLRSILDLAPTRP